ncbi:hypothetical protein SAMD00019534_120840, partial [Acytostelium subglobosum LB1]|uniref:hypothetical protein n=1 Tax=Acytostelium subglobosum LB1 TaxID=1410327 RepID=UPI000645147B
MHGFFYVVNHGVDIKLIERLDSASRQFFALDEQTKMKWRMELGGKAWRGYFPLGGEVTSGKPDMKEGLYLGQELDVTHPLPMHGPNLFPDTPADLKSLVLEYIESVTKLGHSIMEAIALSLGLDQSYFYNLYTKNPLVLFRLFNYKSHTKQGTDTTLWGVGEHTDYGLLTMLYQDDIGGLQVKVPKVGWVPAPPVHNSFICNIGDMLDRVSGGLYKSTPHRVALNTSGRDRLSFPLFFDPNFSSTVYPIPGITINDNDNRWDDMNLFDIKGTYGDYLLNKVGKVFPQLSKTALPNTE